MKKLILIPSLVMASTLPALSIVSCSKSATASWKLGETFEWKHDNPTFSVKDADEATTEYFNRATAQIVADDMIYKVAQSAEHQKEYYDEIIAKATVSKVDKKEHRLSIELYSKMKPKDNLMNADNGYSVPSIEGTMIIKNVPFALSIDFYSHYDATKSWTLHPAGLSSSIQTTTLPDQYWEDQKWSFSVDMIRDGVALKDTIDYRTKDKVDEHQDTIQSFVTSVGFTSFFFSKVTLDAEK